jgi:hypothetical protein
MFYALILVGCFAILTGYFSIFRPNTIIKLSQLGNRLVATDYGYVRYHKVSGILFISIGAFLFYVGFSIF